MGLLTGKFASTTLYPLFAALLQQQQSDAANAANKGTVNDIVSGYGDFGGALNSYLNQTQGYGLTFLNNLWGAGRQNINSAMATSLYGVPYEQIAPGAVWNPDQATAALTPQVTTGNGIVPGESAFDLNWLPPDVRRDADTWRKLLGPNSWFGGLRGYTDQQYNADLWNQFGEYAPESTGDTTTYTGPLTGKTYTNTTPEDVWAQEYGSVGVRVDENGEPVAADLESYLTNEGYITADPTGAEVDEALRGWQGRYTGGMKLLEGLGESARKDIKTEFGNVASEARQNLMNRGLTGTTITSSVESGIAEREVNAIDQLNESLRTEKLNWQSMLSADFLNNMDKWMMTGLNFDTSMGQGVYNAFASGASDRINLATGLADAIASAKGSLIYQGPEQVNWGDVLGGISNARSAWDAANQTDNSSIWQGVGGLAGSGTMLATLAATGNPLLSMLAAQGVNTGVSSVGLFS
jgi:hypothetical protein